MNCKSSSLIQGGIISNKNVFMEVSGINLFKDDQIISNDDGASGSALFVVLTLAKSIALTVFIFENCSAIKSGGSLLLLLFQMKIMKLMSSIVASQTIKL